MADNQHYVIDDGQNKIPGYTKTEVDELIESGAKAWSGTQAEYNALKQAGLLQPRSLYIITDAANLNGTAKNISYDGSNETVWDKVNELDKLTDYTDGLSYHAGVTRYLGSIYKQGKLVVCNLTLRIEQNLNNNDTVVSGLPTIPSRSHKFPCFVGTDQYLIGDSDGAIYLQVNTTSLVRWGNLTATSANPKYMTMMFVYATA